MAMMSRPCERSFSKLTIVNGKYWNTTTRERLNSFIFHLDGGIQNRRAGKEAT